MSDASPAALDQKTLWNGAAGEAWVRGQDMLDTMFRPFEAMLADGSPDDRARVLLLTSDMEEEVRTEIQSVLRSTLKDQIAETLRAEMKAPRISSTTPILDWG